MLAQQVASPAGQYGGVHEVGCVRVFPRRHAGSGHIPMQRSGVLWAAKERVLVFPWPIALKLRPDIHSTNNP